MKICKLKEVTLTETRFPSIPNACLVQGMTSPNPLRERQVREIKGKLAPVIAACKCFRSTGRKAKRSEGENPYGGTFFS
ncbi:MAG: hypothetical protein DRQ02_13050 [Candidatus Latescibacterota bacterium]|nr:MAG: hypothetical protein DRQ02_13050 [Candidatus Latescibacterota bacterium]RKY72330.1 MAG: hypothetical protein DRQ24_05285 [Candidatus Latescibacterota bacterium]